MASQIYQRRLDVYILWILESRIAEDSAYRFELNSIFLTFLTSKALPRQWVALETANLQSLWSRMLTSVSAFFLMSLLMVSM